MNLPAFALRRRAFVIAVFGLLVLAGGSNYATMSRRESPAITLRNAIVITRWEGAPVEQIEELVTDPLEKKIAELSEVMTITSDSRVGQSILNVELDEREMNIDQLWDEVRAKVSEVRLPDGCGVPFVDSDFGDTYDICLALFQRAPSGGWNEHNRIHRYSMRRLEVLAERIEDELKLVPQVARVDFWGVQQEVVYVEVDSADWAKIDLTAQELGDLMEARNIVAPGGEVTTPRGSFAVKPSGAFETVQEINDLVVGRIDGRIPVRLGDVPLRVYRGYEDPPKTKVRYADPRTRGVEGLVLGIAMKDEQNVVTMGANVDAVVRRLKATELPADLELVAVNDLPRQVAGIVRNFGINLLAAMGIVLGVAMLLIGWRAGLVMATAVPFSMVTAFAVVRLFGVELEQFSIAAMIISLGLVVDNATVVTENALRLMGDGLPKRKAVIQGTATMSIPMLAATLTTVAAFLPMLLMVGNVGEFIRSLPIVVAITLLGSYAVAMLVVPLFCMWLLKAPAKHAAAKARPRPKPYERLLNWCLGRKLTVLGIALAAFLGALMLLPVIGSQFFPSGARDQFFVKVWMPEGSPLSATEEVSLRVEEIILGTSKLDEGGEPVERLANMVSFIGSGGPRLMLTQWLEQDYPYFAHIVVNTTSATLTDDWVEQVRREVRSIPGARIEVFPFTMGPPIDTPVAFRVIGKDAGLLRAAAEDMLAVMRRTPGALNPFSDWGASAYQVAVDVDSTAANLAGVTNAEVARTMHALLSGARLTTYREGDHQIPVVLRTIPSRRARLGELTGIFVNGRTGKVPLASLATVTPTWEPAVISRRNNVRAITVGCRVETGRLANQVASAIRPKLEAIVAGLPLGYRLEEAGEKEETTDAQAKMARAVQIAMLLIVLVLVTQYNSFLKPLVILCTLPMALIGVIVGLWITGWAMGFMAMLGVLSLFGIVINDAIVLIDFIEEKVRAGMPLRPAVVLAGRLRMKPIFLTSLTTVGGLLPLALFAGPMWAPMAWAMIFGLLFATILTLVIVPVFYVLFAERLRMQVVQPADSAAAGGV